MLLKKPNYVFILVCVYLAVNMPLGKYHENQEVILMKKLAS